ncbi:unnamed protein product [Amoebophrya sp. A120]|nr:unnamed protein product [Amoebophrya sp. A120]|eukprot:GSA120T00016449001.1
MNLHVQGGVSSSASGRMAPAQGARSSGAGPVPAAAALTDAFSAGLLVAGSGAASTDKLVEMQQTISQLTSEKKMYMDMAHALKGNIRVFCRIRPNEEGTSSNLKPLSETQLEVHSSSAAASSSSSGTTSSEVQSGLHNGVAGTTAGGSSSSSSSSSSSGSKKRLDHLRRTNTYTAAEMRKFDASALSPRNSSMLGGAGNKNNINTSKSVGRIRHSSTTLHGASSGGGTTSIGQQSGGGGTTNSSDPKIFFFDKLFPEQTTDDFIYENSIKEEVNSFLNGFNVALIAYGATGSGKTHTISHIFRNLCDHLGETMATGPGCASSATRTTCATTVVPGRSASSSSTLGGRPRSLKIQLLEIYNEQIRDLLVESKNRTSSNVSEKNLLKITTTDGTDNSTAGAQHGANNSTAIKTVVQNATTIELDLTKNSTQSCTSMQDSLTQIFEFGKQNRATSVTNVHDRSSRSHLIISLELIVHDENKNCARTASKLTLVDLAGSERLKKSEATGDRLKEAQYINKSLSALQDVIWALERKISHIPYRNSKLTHLLQDSLCNKEQQGRTVIFVTVDPRVANTQESLQSLQFGSRLNSVSFNSMLYKAENLFSSVDLLEQNRLQAKLNVEEKKCQELKQENEKLHAELKQKDEKVQELRLEMRDIRVKLQQFMQTANRGGTAESASSAAPLPEPQRNHSASTLEHKFMQSEEERHRQGAEIKRLREQLAAASTSMKTNSTASTSSTAGAVGGGAITAGEQQPHEKTYPHNSNYTTGATSKPSAAGSASFRPPKRVVGAGRESTNPTAQQQHQPHTGTTPGFRSPRSSRGPATYNSGSPRGTRAASMTQPAPSSSNAGAVYSAMSPRERVMANKGGTAMSQHLTSRGSPRGPPHHPASASVGHRVSARGSVSSHHAPSQTGPRIGSSSTTVGSGTRGSLQQEVVHQRDQAEEQHRPPPHIKKLYNQQSLSANDAQLAESASSSYARTAINTRSSLQQHQQPQQLTTSQIVATSSASTASILKPTSLLFPSCSGGSAEQQHQQHHAQHRAGVPTATTTTTIQVGPAATRGPVTTQFESGTLSSGGSSGSSSGHHRHSGAVGSSTNSRGLGGNQQSTTSRNNGAPTSRSVGPPPVLAAKNTTSAAGGSYSSHLTTHQRAPGPQHRQQHSILTTPQRYFIQPVTSSEAKDFCKQYTHLQDVDTDNAECIILGATVLSSQTGRHFSNSFHVPGGGGQHVVTGGAGTSASSPPSGYNHLLRGGGSVGSKDSSGGGAGSFVLGGAGTLQRVDSQVSVSSTGSEIKYRLQKSLMMSRRGASGGSGSGPSGGLAATPNASRTVRTGTRR